MNKPGSGGKREQSPSSTFSFTRRRLRRNICRFRFKRFTQGVPQTTPNLPGPSLSIANSYPNTVFTKIYQMTSTAVNLIMIYKQNAEF